MRWFLKWLNKGRTAGEIVSIDAYRLQREEALREYHNIRDMAKEDLEEATRIPTAIYRQTVDSALADFQRIEEELWQEHKQRVMYSDFGR